MAHGSSEEAAARLARSLASHVSGQAYVVAPGAIVSGGAIISGCSASIVNVSIGGRSAGVTRGGLASAYGSDSKPAGMDLFEMINESDKRSLAAFIKYSGRFPEAMTYLDDQGNTALHHAFLQPATLMNREIILLLANGFKENPHIAKNVINIKNNKGYAALHRAISVAWKHDDPEFGEALINLLLAIPEIDLEIKTPSGKTSLDLASDLEMSNIQALISKALSDKSAVAGVMADSAALVSAASAGSAGAGSTIATSGGAGARSATTFAPAVSGGISASAISPDFRMPGGVICASVIPPGSIMSGGVISGVSVVGAHFAAASAAHVATAAPAARAAFAGSGAEADSEGDPTNG